MWWGWVIEVDRFFARRNSDAISYDTLVVSLINHLAICDGDGGKCVSIRNVSPLHYLAFLRQDIGGGLCSRSRALAHARSRALSRALALAFAHSLSLSPSLSRPLSLSLIYIYIYIYHLSRFPFAYLYQCLVISPSVALYRFKLVWKLYLMLLEQHSQVLVETVRIIVEWGASNMGHHLLPQPNGEVYVFISVGL